MAEGSEVVTLKIPINGKSVSIGKLKKDSTHIIVVDPDTVPEGYEVPESVTVTPTSTNTKVTAEFNLAKQTKDITLVAADEDSKEAISATLAVYDSDNNKVTTFKYGNTYTVKEEKAPYGYEGDKSATFTIGNDGTVTAEGADYSDGKLTIYDKKLFGNTVKISTVSKDLGNPIEGAKFTITHKDTNTEVVSDYSGTDPLTLSLPAGEYVIHQDAAPYGFNTASDVTFVVDEDGNITVNGSNVDGTVTMENPYNNSENTSVDSLFGDTSESFAGKKYAVFTYTGDDFDPITATPVHLFYYDPDQAVDSSFNGFHQQTPYILVDMDNLSSFNLLESKIFKSSRLPKLDDSGNPTGETEDVLAVTSTKSGAVTKITLDDPSVSATDLTKTIASSVVPKKPVAPSSSSANGSPAASGSSGQTSGSSSSNSKATNSALNMKENDIVMGADLTAGDGSDASKGPRLAKTGGFIGTLGGYFAAVACILVGLFLALGKKKEYDK